MNQPAAGQPQGLASPAELMFTNPNMSVPQQNIMPAQSAQAPQEFANISALTRDLEYGADQWIQIDLGYNIIYVMPEQTAKARVRCLLACCPCLYGGIRNAFNVFWSRGIFRTFIVIVSCIDVIMFFIEIAVNDGFSSPNDNPLIGPSYCAFQRMQARISSAIVYHKQVWRLVVPIFLHGGVVHLFVNVYSQLGVGVGDEYRWGSGFMALVYMFTGIFGNVLSSVGYPEKISVGASGAIMGIIGCSAAHTAVTWEHAEPVLRNTQVFSIGLSLVMLIAIGAAVPDRIDNWTHAGGFISGLCVGLCYFRKYCVSDLAKVVCVCAGVGIVCATVCLFVVRTPPPAFKTHTIPSLSTAPLSASSWCAHPTFISPHLHPLLPVFNPTPTPVLTPPVFNTVAVLVMRAHKRMIAHAMPPGPAVPAC
mmetsp:Transcript_60015/g.159513  ORF Transcript_60015/g.159513 Transcript_60015/m.159513 type:complete len:421 (+) Transcript_60015:123-1385(+)